MAFVIMAFVRRNLGELPDQVLHFSFEAGNGSDQYVKPP